MNRSDLSGGSQDSRPSPVLGFIGLGVMGEPMCANLVRKTGARVLCFDLNAAPMERLVTHGAQPVASVAQVAVDADIVFLCLASAPATNGVVEQLCSAWADGSRPRVVVDLGTTSLAATRAIAQALANAGHRFADAPVARMPAAAIAGTLSIMLGADDALADELEPLLRCMGTDITRCGGTGNGQVVKILHNTVLFETVNALAEAMAIAERHGVQGQVLLDAIELGSADCQAARVQGRQSLLPRSYPEGRFATRYALKDVSLALELADLAGLRAQLAQLTAATLQRTVQAGFGDRYYPALYEVVSGRAGSGD